MNRKLFGILVSPLSAPIGCLGASFLFSVFYKFEMGVYPGLVKAPGFFIFSSIYGVIGSYIGILSLSPFIFLVLHKRLNKLFHAQLSAIFFGVGGAFLLSDQDILIWYFGLIYAAFISLCVSTSYWWIAIRPDQK